MEGSSFDEVEFFRAIQESGARALLIGRRALVALGIPVLTADYDLWVHPDDVTRLNAALAPLDLFPGSSRPGSDLKGRYVLENDERVDVLAARSVQTIDGARVEFETLWGRRLLLDIEAPVHVAVPNIDDLILTKRFAARPKDAEDIRLLELLKKRETDR
jgi:hypothetical protein